MLRSLKCTLWLLLPLVFLSGCAQWWQVRPYSEFVDAELNPGDQIRVETRDGERSKMVVVAVTGDRIIGENQTVLLKDIAQLEKHSDTPPANPCSPQVPLGCSTPQWATLLHDSQSHYTEYFYPSCEQHDYCYRHGATTYGLTRNVCDDQFLLDMQTQCQPDNIGDVLLQGGYSFTACGAVALEFFMAVQKYGANRFNTGSGTYCEYNGPP